MRLALKNNSTFRQRTITSIIAIPVVIILIWFGWPWFTIFAAGWSACATYEFYAIVRNSKGVLPLTWFGLIWVALLVFSPHIRYEHSLPLIITGAVIIPLVYSLGRTRGKENAFANWAWTIAGIFYIGWLVSYMVALRSLPDGRGWVMLAMGATFASDICAFLAGRTFGKHRLAPYISPNKTWEGSLAGIAGAVAVSILIVRVFNLPVGYLEAVLLGVLISAAGQIGDLVKSLFKRNSGVKDSGKAIPGHGGFLDRTDSMAFAGLVVYLYVFYIVLRG